MFAPFVVAVLIALVVCGAPSEVNFSLLLQLVVSGATSVLDQHLHVIFKLFEFDWKIL